MDIQLMERRRVAIDTIHIGARHREPDMAKVKEIAKSISEIGLLNPPAVTFRDGIILDGESCDNVAVLIYGRHRLLALRDLGEVAIECIVHDVDDLHAELMEIAENLHRAELTALERDVQVARWIELTAKSQAAESVLRQADAKPGRPEGGVRAAARVLGLSEAAARRAVKVASLSQEAKAEAVSVKVDDNQSALIAAAKWKEPEKQVEVIRAYAKPAPISEQEKERIQQREERYKQELAEFMMSVEAMEPLLKEIEFQGEDEEGNEVPFAYDGLSYLQFAERYKPLIAARPYRWSIGYGGAARDASRRVEAALRSALEIMCDKAEVEITRLGATTENLTDADIPAFLKKDAA